MSSKTQSKPAFAVRWVDSGDSIFTQIPIGWLPALHFDRKDIVATGHCKAVYMIVTSYVVASVRLLQCLDRDNYIFHAVKADIAGALLPS
jgi:hypothetical protein